MYKRVKVNKIKCKHCGDIIESTSVHNFVTCSCGTVSVDGGHDYARRMYRNSPDEDYEDLSEFEHRICVNCAYASKDLLGFCENTQRDKDIKNNCLKDSTEYCPYFKLKEEYENEEN